MFMKLLSLLFLLYCPWSHAATVVTFDGTMGDLDFDAISGSFTDMDSGLTVTLSANIGDVNATSTSLGINAPDGGDETDQLDLDNGLEVLTVSFDQSVIINSFELAEVGTDDGLRFTFDDVDVDVFTTGVTTFDTVLFAGSVLTIQAIDAGVNADGENLNNGVAIENFIVTVIPEPSTFILIICSGCFFIQRRRVVS